ncbi:flagellar filament capping protein FliD [Heyndrickxia ginsengihumi]|uniref:flagellar filament capping protein FliD n=1 Tax=Heyndrickxia ginsengihumi TaxID=363870 RepID=UPI003D1B1278
MVQRIVGLASGMDIDSMVKSMMDAAKQPLIKLQQKQQTLEWQRDDYRTLNQKFFDFRSTLTNMKLTSQYRARTTTSSNEGIVTATASNLASLSTSTINSVDQLATSATYLNAGAISASGKKVDATDSLSNQLSNFGNAITWNKGAVVSQSKTALTSSNTISLDTTNPPSATNFQMNVEVNGKLYTVKNQTGTPTDDDTVFYSNGQLTFKTALSANSKVNVTYAADSYTSTKSISSSTTSIQLSHGAIDPSTFQMKINNSTYTIDTSGTDATKMNVVDSNGSTIGTLNTNTGLLTITNNPVANSSNSVNAQITYQQNYTSFNLTTYTSKGKEDGTFFVQGNETLNNVITDVNDSDIGLNIMYDDNSDRLTMTRTETGDFNSSGADISASGSFILNTLRFDNSGTPAAQEKDGTNASFTINGLATTRSSNTFTINGVTYTLKGETTSPVTISVSNDTDTIFNNIKSFVDQYNDLISTVQSKLDEERYTDYPPLTDDQRSQMTDTQQDQWDEKAKSGLLKGDMTLTSALSNMRSLIYSPVQNSKVSSAYNQLSSIGITTSPDYTQGGKLIIDEDKLKEAIENDPDSVENLFRGTGDSTSEEGIIQRLYDSVNNTYNTIVDKAGTSTSVNAQFTIGQDLDQLSDQIDAMNDKLDDLENKYYAQFDAMEQAIQQYNNQATSIQSYFSS